jgi:transcriptional regulator with XRE-family HTH domain
MTLQIGLRIKELREAKGLSQGDIEKKTSLLRCYTSRVENGHTVPSIETLAKFANALEVPVAQLIGSTNGHKLFRLSEKLAPTLTTKDNNYLERLALLLPKINERDRKILLMSAKTYAGAK